MAWQLVSKKEHSKGQKAEMSVLIRPRLSSFLALFIGHTQGQPRFRGKRNKHPSLWGNIGREYFQCIQEVKGLMEAVLSVSTTLQNTFYIPQPQGKSCFF